MKDSVEYIEALAEQVTDDTTDRSIDAILDTAKKRFSEAEKLRTEVDNSVGIREYDSQ